MIPPNRKDLRCCSMRMWQFLPPQASVPFQAYEANQL